MGGGVQAGLAEKKFEVTELVRMVAEIRFSILQEEMNNGGRAGPRWRRCSLA